MQIIVAANRDWGIGKDGGLLVHLSPDLRRFKALTLGKTVLMGRRTLEGLPGGRPLPGRRNLVLTHDPAFSAPGAEVCRSAAEALARAAETPPDDFFVIGGAEVYRTFLPHCARALVTRFEADAPADVFFPDLDALPAWRETARSERMEWNGIPFRYVDYEQIG